ncbi:MAG TPA: DUF4384 domain-containing protein, partial [Gemmatimonadales bacterium]|nr:DUF4384 domain-containing protein [Gemmatimonadales bacterium]
MFSSLLLSALVLGAPPGGPPAAANHQDDPAIRIWLSDDGRYQRGDQAKVQVKTREDGYLLVLNVDPDGRLRVLFPLDPTDDSQVRGGKTYQIVGRGGREGFTVTNRTGQGTVYATVSRSPYRFDGYIAGDHWDFAALDDVRLSDKPENDLNDFVRSIAGGDFDYDVLGYGVFEQVVYAEPNSALYDDGYDYAFDGGYGYGGGYGYYGGTSLFIGLSFGHRHRFYDPFYSPFYSPFYYSPYFYSPFYPAFYNPYYYNPYYYYPRPFRPFPVAFFPTRPFYGGYFGSPWRNRVNDPIGRGGFEWWRGRQSTFGSGATLASAYHRSFFDRSQVAPARGSIATPVRGTVATTDAAIMRRRAPDMTPTRIESTRARNLASRPVETANGPTARRAVDRTESWAARIPNGGRGEVTRRGTERSRDVGQASEPRAVRSTVVERNRGGDVTRVERDGYEGTRVAAPRTYEARRAEDDRPGSRPTMEPRRMDGGAPAR